jgi:hypothetical protein
LIAYKVLRADGSSPFTGFRWELNGDGTGAWVEAPVDPCRSGIHACRAADLPYWTGPVLVEVELDGEIVECRSKVIAPRGRLLRRLAAWEDEVREAYQVMCAERARRLTARAAPKLDEWDGMVDGIAAQGPGPAGFIAARVAEEIDGPDAFRAERAVQAAWLSERLGFEV